MTAVILQPSYIAWRGYFDQVRRADLFIFYDDVQYDRRGWRNRNQIKTRQGKLWLTIPVQRAPTDVLIRDVRIDWSKDWRRNHLQRLTFAYGKAPYFDECLPLLESFYARRDEFLADFTIATSIALARQLGFASTRFLRSSELAGIQGQKTDRLVEILRRVGATHYLSGPSAGSYMEPDKFSAAGITFELVEYDYPEYPQLYPPYDPNVSILDLLFMMGRHAGSAFAKTSDR